MVVGDVGSIFACEFILLVCELEDDIFRSAIAIEFLDIFSLSCLINV